MKNVPNKLQQIIRELCFTRSKRINLFKKTQYWPNFESRIKIPVAKGIGHSFHSLVLFFI